MRLKLLRTRYKVLVVAVMIMAFKAYDSLRPWTNVPSSKANEEEIYLVSHGWHAGIVISGSNLSPELAFLEDHFGQNSFYEIGWGDKGFYQAENVTTTLAVKAFLWPTDSVMHVAALQKSPFAVFSESEIVPMKIAKSGFENLQAQLAASFKKENSTAVKTKNGLYGNSLFFKGKGYYYLTNTCNTWTARMLKTSRMVRRCFLTFWRSRCCMY